MEFWLHIGQLYQCVEPLVFLDSFLGRLLAQLGQMVWLVAVDIYNVLLLVDEVHLASTTTIPAHVLLILIHLLELIILVQSVHSGVDLLHDLLTTPVHLLIKHGGLHYHLLLLRTSMSLLHLVAHLLLW